MSRRAMKWVMGAVSAAVFSLVSVKAVAHSVDFPQSMEVSLTGNGAPVLRRGSVSGDYIGSNVVATFACPAPSRLYEIEVRTEHQRITRRVNGGGSLRTSFPFVKLVGTDAMRQACADGSRRVDARVWLAAVCIDPLERDFERSLRASSRLFTVPITATCSSVPAPRFVPARVTPRQYRHTCDGRSVGPLTTSTRPRNCADRFDPSSPQLSEAEVYGSRYECESGWILRELPRRAHDLDRTQRWGMPETYAFGETRWCRRGTPRGAHLSQVATARVGRLQSHFGNVTQLEQARARVTTRPPDPPPGQPVCKRGDLWIYDGSVREQMTGGDTLRACGSGEDEIPISLETDTARARARDACAREAQRLRRAGRWERLPVSGNGRLFRATTTVGFDVVGRYCFGARTPSGSNWEYRVDCLDHTYLAEWSDQGAVNVTVDCIDR